MVEESEDAGVVTERIVREMRDAHEAARAREAAAALQAVSTGHVETVAADLSVVRSEQPVPPPVDAETAYRHGRLGVVAMLVLVLLWAWIQERRRTRQERG